MKLQDIIFLLSFLFLFWKGDARLAAVVGLVALGISMPLFGFWVFFTAERLTWYAASFFLLALVLPIVRKSPNQAE